MSTTDTITSPVGHSQKEGRKEMFYLTVCGIVHIKELLLLIKKNRFPLTLSEWSFTICTMPYNRI